VTEIVPFAFNGTELRTVLIDDQPWFAAADAAKILGYRDAANAVRILRERHRGTHPMSTPGGIQDLTVVSEPGIYRLAMRSDLPAAEDFQDWIVDEVLPAIRKTGRYEQPDDQPQPIASPLADHISGLDAAARAGYLPRSEAKRTALQLLADAGLVQPPPAPPTPAESVLRWVRHRELAEGDTFSLRDAHRGLAGQHWAYHSEAVAAVLADLVDAGHLRKTPRPAGIMRGRPPGPRFEVIATRRQIGGTP
jgi:hypothetical protein